MLGISVYLGNDFIENMESYLVKMKRMGFTSIFTSLHIPEDNPQLYTERLQRLGKGARENRMELMADISPRSLGHLGFTWENAEGLLKWGLTGLRLDYGISETEMIQLSQKMKIALNASTLKKDMLTRLKEGGLKMESVEAWHNFYPRPETGLDRKDFTNENVWLEQEGLTVVAFIPGDGALRGPLYKKLPTLEAHRTRSSFESYLDLVTNCSVEKVLVGDLTLNEESIEQFANYSQGVVVLRAVRSINDETLLGKLATVHTNRSDTARDCIRSSASREYGLFGTGPIRPFNTCQRQIGAITVDNEKYGRYQGEIQITKRDLEADEKVNVLGRVIESDRLLLRYILGGMKFQIYWV